MNFETLEMEFSHYANCLVFREILIELTSVPRGAEMSEQKKGKALVTIPEIGIYIPDEAFEFCKTVFKLLTEKVLKRLGKTGGHILDWVDSEIVTNQLVRTYTKFERLGIEPQPVSPKSLLPILQSMSLETEATLQEMWGNLLTMAITYGDVHPSHIEIMKQLGPIDAKVLDAFWKTSVVPSEEEGGMYDGSHYKKYPPHILAIKKQTNGGKIREFLERENSEKIEKNKITESIAILAEDGMINILGYSGNEEHTLNLTLKGGRFMRAVTGEIE
jgi:hypothetical protein